MRPRKANGAPGERLEHTSRCPLSLTPPLGPQLPAVSKAVHPVCQAVRLKDFQTQVPEPWFCLGSGDQASAAGLNDVFPKQHGVRELPTFKSQGTLSVEPVKHPKMPCLSETRVTHRSAWAMTGNGITVAGGAKNSHSQACLPLAPFSQLLLQHRAQTPPPGSPDLLLPEDLTAQAWRSSPFSSPETLFCLTEHLILYSFIPS